ncbi:single Ig IL-1-related receptor-like [Microplitis mediator]|uniref:single Ig IL-1-related receptor-like n=1 Tax=Microplitis mediator TaxID=375433 RepID=UPI0025534D0C|nr:single Ig IL-1-related receptor-like [Microplitis mediator]
MAKSRIILSRCCIYYIHALVMFSMIVLVIAGPPPPRDDELEEYCLMHRFDKLPGGLRFTKEVVSTEYANVGAFKAIHCCLRGYRSIEWYKDDRPYPWPGALSHFILFPESANQTIYTRAARVSDAGIYSCRARNDTDTLSSDISLGIVGEDSSGYTGKPLPTYKPISQLVPFGDAARLFCEAYLGKVDLPDAKNSVTWTKAGSNITFSNTGRVSNHRVSREDDQIVGCYLEIESTIPEDYGEYECRISNGADEEMTLSAYIYRREPHFDFGLRSGSWRKALLFAVLGLVLFVSIGAFFVRCWLPMAVICHNKFQKSTENDGKEFDAVVCYHEKDAALAVNTLIPTLKTKYNYKCSTLELTHLTRNWNLEIGSSASSSRRVIVILSPNALENEWTDTKVTQALKQLSLISNQVVVIILNELSNVAAFAKSTGHCVDAACADGIVLDKMTILRWKVDSEKDTGGYKFWCRLRLALPPVRSTPTESSPDFQTRCQSVAMIVQNNNKSTPQKTQSRESLEVLV